MVLICNLMCCSAFQFASFGFVEKGEVVGNPASTNGIISLDLQVHQIYII